MAWLSSVREVAQACDPVCRNCHPIRRPTDADQVAISPDQPAVSYRTEIIKGDLEFGRYDVQPFEADARPLISNVADAA